MKKVLCFIFILTLSAAAVTPVAFAAEDKPSVKSGEALLVDMESGKFLYKSNIDAKIAPGGFTKIMTAIVAIENMLDKNEIVTAKSDILAAYDYSFGNMGILAGETLTLEDLLYGMMLYDAGDAAEVIADYSFESRSKFIKKMNEKAVELGALNTKFKNPSGYPDKNQYTTLEDMYTITKYALDNELFAEIVNTGMYEIQPTNKYTQTRYLPNSNKFITRYSSDKYYTSKAKGVKTSYIDDDECGLILQYKTDDVNLMCLVAEAPYDGNLNYAYEDSKALIKYGTDFYTPVKVVKRGDILAEVELNNGKETDRLLLEAPEDSFVNLPKNYDKDKIEIKVEKEKNIKAPINKGQALGIVKILYSNEEYTSMILTSPQSVKADNIKGFFRSVWKVISAPALLVTLGILLIIFVWSTLIFNRKKQLRINKHK